MFEVVVRPMSEWLIEKIDVVLVEEDVVVTERLRLEKRVLI